MDRSHGALLVIRRQ